MLFMRVRVHPDGPVFYWEHANMGQGEAIKVGHLLRWLKQLALRGRSRQFDSAGCSGAQKLVVTGDKLLFVEHGERLLTIFPVPPSGSAGPWLLWALGPLCAGRHPWPVMLACLSETGG
jgi:hypothetical protein